MNKAAGCRKVVLGLLSFFLMASACSSDHDLNDEEDWGTRFSEPTVVLTISPLSISNTSVNQPREMIRSLRIIMLNDDKVELNELIRFDGTEENEDMFIGSGAQASNFTYIFTRPTIVGEKKFFLIANEESVGQISYQASANIPADIQKIVSLKDLLNSYPSDSEETKSFADVINSVIFKPNYQPDDKNYIYLPYASYYEGFEIRQNASGKGTYADYIEQPMYLVPVATKMEIQFANYRKSDVVIDEVKFSKMNQTSFLMAHLDSPHLNYGEGNSVYWIDWLKMVSDGSWNNTDYEDNVNYNEAGWITGYSVPIPGASDLKEIEIIKPTDEFNVPMNESKVQAGYNYLGQYYFGESRNLTNGVTEEQSYSFTFKMHDSNTVGEYQTFTNSKLPNLQSLFRNTYVRINVQLYTGEANIYAEVMDWNYNYFQGFVQEER